MKDENLPGVEAVSPVRIYVEGESYSASQDTKGYNLITRLKVTSDHYGNILSDGISKAEKNAFSKLEEEVRNQEGNVAVIAIRHLSGIANVQLEVVADVYNINPFPSK